MSELKVHRFITTDELFPEANAGALYYDKSEADKVIADLEESHKMEVEQLLIEISELKEKYKELAKLHDKAIQACCDADNEIRHHKYKRCLANAEACMHKRWRTDEGFDYARSTRHMKKWLDMAKKGERDKCYASS